MTQSQQDAMAKFNQLSRQREEFEGSEKKVKKLRKIAAIVFLISFTLLIIFQLVLNSTVSIGNQIKTLFSKIAGLEYLFLILGVVSFALLLVSVVKAINVQMKAEEARRQEGTMAEQLFRSMLSSVEND